MSYFIKEILESKKESEQTAICYKNEMVSYKILYDKASAISEVLSGLEIDMGRNVGIYIPNSIDYSVAYFGITMLKKTIVPIHYLAKKDEILSTIEYCDLRVIITNSEYLEIMKGYLEELEYKLYVVVVDTKKVFCFKEDREYVPLVGQEVLEDVAIMLHTSGTTSNPKRVMLTHYNLQQNILSNISSLKLTDKDTTLITLPMCFGYCNTAQFLTHLYLGAKVVIMDGIFFPKKFFELVQKEKVTNYTGVPSALILLSRFKERYQYNLESLKFICFGGGVMPLERLNELVDKFPNVKFLQTYGQTEASPRLTIIGEKDYKEKMGSVGKPIPNVKIKLLIDNVLTEATNQIGEICAQGPNIMKGYYKRPEETNKILVDGWLHTGDLGYIDDAGDLYIVGRKKNMIISGGINIYPEEIEEILLAHPQIESVLVKGIEDPILQEKVVAYIVPNENETLDIEEVQKYCNEHLANYKQPKAYFVVDQLEKTITGKVRR